MIKVIAQSVYGNSVLVDLGEGQGSIVEIKTKRVFRPTKIAKLLRRLPWVPFKGNDEDVLAVLEEQGIKG